MSPASSVLRICVRVSRVQVRARPTNLHSRATRALAPAAPLCALTLIAALASAVHAQNRGRGGAARLPLADSLATWYALGINAHHLCAGLWVVGRDNVRSPETVVAQDIRRFPAFRWEDDFTYSVDSATHIATISDPQVGSRSAKYSADQGCAILPAETRDVFFQPVRTGGHLPDAASQDWPMGDRNAAARFPDIHHDSIEATLDWAFDDSTGFSPAQNTRGIVVVHRGRIIAERYAPGWSEHTPQLSWSMGKSIAATLIGVLVQQGKLKLDQPAPIAEWQGAKDPRRDIRIADLMHMSSGLDFDNFGLDPRSSYIAANEHFRIYFDALDVAAHAINQPLRYEPGTVWRYRNSDPLTVTLIARRTAVAMGEDPLGFAQHMLFDRLGIRSAVLEADAWGNFVITGFDFMSTRDWARLELLYLRDGMWNGERILPEGFADFVSTPAPGDPSRGYGGLFWLNRGGAMRRLPADAYWAAGYMGQTAMVIPSRDLVVVRQGPSPGGDQRYFEELVARVLRALPASR
jgi:CubicO group peptidase (beta-lactamase class C family)